MIDYVLLAYVNLGMMPEDESGGTDYPGREWQALIEWDHDIAEELGSVCPDLIDSIDVLEPGYYIIRQDHAGFSAHEFFGDDETAAGKRFDELTYRDDAYSDAREEYLGQNGAYVWDEYR